MKPLLDVDTIADRAAYRGCHKIQESWGSIRGYLETEYFSLIAWYACVTA